MFMAGREARQLLQISDEALSLAIYLNLCPLAVYHFDLATLSMERVQPPKTLRFYLIR